MRSEDVRHRVLERDGFRCQVTGYGHDPEERKLLEVHHWARLGMGGSEELDTVENAITLSAEVHGKIHAPKPTMRIIHWAPTDKISGLVVEERVDGEWTRMAERDLWFYRRQDAVALEEEIDLVRQIQMTEPKHAEVIAHIWANYDLVSNAASPEQFVAGLGLDPNRAKDEAHAVWWIKGMDLRWPDGLNLRKILLVASIDILERKTAQEILDGAVDMSYTDLCKELVEKGLKLATYHWYLVLRPWRGWGYIAQPRTLFVHSRDRELVLRRLVPGDKLIEVNAFRAGIRWSKKERKLYDQNDNEIYFEEWIDSG